MENAMCNYTRDEKEMARKRTNSGMSKMLQTGVKCNIFAAYVFWNPTYDKLDGIMHLPQGMQVPDVNSLLRDLNQHGGIRQKPQRRSTPRKGRPPGSGQRKGCRRGRRRQKTPQARDEIVVADPGESSSSDSTPPPPQETPERKSPGKEWDADILQEANMGDSDAEAELDGDPGMSTWQEGHGAVLIPPSPPTGDDVEVSLERLGGGYMQDVDMGDIVGVEAMVRMLHDGPADGPMPMVDDASELSRPLTNNTRLPGVDPEHVATVDLRDGARMVVALLGEFKRLLQA
ncbi:hypothetical protein PG994_015141 [Apiospora phragmitis]|uniref:Uncharacterized protein n=1 Tax=Apiospora phragmitis TaxID=2905665 RepID=A0ABR1SXC5_9PEZI